MVVGEILVVSFDGRDDIAFHDLHVVDIVEKLKIWAAYFLGECDAPLGSGRTCSRGGSPWN